MGRSQGHILESVFATGSTETHSGVTRSAPFTSIEKMVFDRKRDALSFFTASGTQMISISSHRTYDRLPYATTTIGDVTYTITTE